MSICTLKNCLLYKIHVNVVEKTRQTRESLYFYACTATYYLTSYTLILSSLYLPKSVERKEGRFVDFLFSVYGSRGKSLLESRGTTFLPD